MTQKTRFAQAALFVAIWMALGWLLHLEAYGYLLLGLPLCVLFQIFVRRSPLSSCWVGNATTMRLDFLGVPIAFAFMIAPIFKLVAVWPSASWALRFYLFAAIFGALGVAFALRRFTAVSIRCLLLCLATAGLLGCAWMLFGAVAQHHR
jgi:hypothetical protein